MTRCLLRAKFGIALLTAVACLFLIKNPSTAKPVPNAPKNAGEPVPTANDRQITRWYASSLKGHLARPPLNDDLSKDSSSAFKTLDLPRFIRQKDLEDLLNLRRSRFPASSVRSTSLTSYARFTKRAGERVKLVEELLASQDFDSQSMDTDYDKMDSPPTMKSTRLGGSGQVRSVDAEDWLQGSERSEAKKNDLDKKKAKRRDEALTTPKPKKKSCCAIRGW